MDPMIKAAKVITKVCEVFHWVGAALMTAAAVCALAAPHMVKYFVGITATEAYGAELNVYGFEVVVPMPGGALDMHTFFLFGVGAILILAIMALIFRYLNQVIRTAETGTPFRPENVRRLKRVGILSIAIPVVGLVMSAVVRLVLGVDAVETSVNLYGFCMGIIVLCLTQFFIRGVQLEEDVDGLL